MSLSHHVLQELTQLDSQICDTSVILKMDNTRDLDMDLILKNVEAWYQNIAHTSKQEAEAFYHNKVSAFLWKSENSEIYLF